MVAAPYINQMDDLNCDLWLGRHQSCCYMMQIYAATIIGFAKPFICSFQLPYECHDMLQA